ncbi:ANTAR domain-containing protein [Mycolicibacterium elephantis]|uniref:ANTAR domain-containing protein n=3 Tax=Mycolicibacterium elephantis TaxID=81858 RepID=UPI003A852F26
MIALLQRVLERMQADLPESLGISVCVYDRHGGEGPSVIAALGIGEELVGAQLSGLGGPVADALSHQVPVLSLDLWTDERWPDLTLEAITAREPGLRSSWERVHGSAAAPGVWQDDATVVVACTLTEPATAATMTTLINYEQLVSAAFVSTAAKHASAFSDLLSVLQSRGAIEQAKGALMGRVGCDAEQAWNILRRASQQFNVKLRELAVALIEHISGAPAEQPRTPARIAPDQPARTAARLLWSAMAESARPRGRSD